MGEEQETCFDFAKRGLDNDFACCRRLEEAASATERIPGRWCTYFCEV